MKKVLSISLAIVFLMQSTAFLWVTAAFYARQKYIAENLCVKRFEKNASCKGKCYLNKKMQQSEENEKKSPELKLKEAELFTQIFEIEVPFQSHILMPLLKGFHLQQHISVQHLHAVFHPPQLV